MLGLSGDSGGASSLQRSGVTEERRSGAQLPRGGGVTSVGLVDEMNLVCRQDRGHHTGHTVIKSGRIRGIIQRPFGAPDALAQSVDCSLIE